MSKTLGNLNSSEISDIADEEGTSPRYTLKPVPKLPFLPDDCLLNIMKYLGPVDLYRLSNISDRLKFLVEDKSLWKRIDFRPHRLTAAELVEYLKYFNHGTKFVALQGFISNSTLAQWSRRVITPRLLSKISERSPALETMITQAVTFEFTLGHFPGSLTCLDLKKSIVLGIDPRKSYFHGMHNFFPNLKVLILSRCKWVSPHDFMAISKCPKLEELRLDGCPQLGDCVAYTSLAARFGFRSLKILDLRQTRMGDSDVICFSHMLTLSQLYLQSPPSDSEDSSGESCSETTCVDLSDNEFSESSDDDDDEVDISQMKSPNKPASQMWFPPPVFHMNSSPDSPRHSKKTHDYKSDHISLVVKNRNEKVIENGNLDLPQASTSHGTLHILMNPAAPSAARIRRKRNRERKQPTVDSGSSSDDNSASESNDINNGKSNSDTTDCSSTSADGKKRIYSKKTGHASMKSKRQCSEVDSVLHNKTNPSSFAIPGCSTSAQEVADSPPSSRVIIISTTASSSEGNSENSSGTQNVSANVPFQMPLNDQSNHSRKRSKLKPHFFRLPNTEASSESLITDMCIMSYVLDNVDADHVGYVRLLSPQRMSARSRLHTLVVRNYKMITDSTLQYLVKLPSLRYLDVSGTSVTDGGVFQFQVKRPDVFVVFDKKKNL